VLGRSRCRRVSDLNRAVKKRFRVFPALLLLLILLLILLLLLLAVGEPYILALTFLDLFRSRNLHLSFLRRRNLDLGLLSLHCSVDLSDHIKSSSCRAKISALREITFQAIAFPHTLDLISLALSILVSASQLNDHLDMPYDSLDPSLNLPLWKRFPGL
jgi:hypothetical protein